MSDTSAAFVRTEPVPPSPPPSSAMGPVKWAKDNLFSTPFYIFLTFFATYVIYLILSNTLPWMLKGVWTTSSLAECREVLDGVSGGCFSILTERWNQLLFGFKYPADQYWRPALTFLFFFAAAAPVLFFKMPRKFLMFTGIFPFVAYYLIWGGSIWTPILVLVGLVFGYWVYRLLVSKSFAAGFFGGIVTAIIIWAVGDSLISDKANVGVFLQAVPSRDLGGFMLNMMLGVVCALAFCTPRHSSCSGSAIEYAIDKVDLRCVYRIHSWRATDYAIICCVRHVGIFLSTGYYDRSILTSGNYDHSIFWRLHRGSNQRRPCSAS